MPNEISKNHSPQLILGLLVLAASASIMSTDLYAPSLPHLPKLFGTSPELVKLTMSLNLLGYALAQLFYGPVSDRYGRRPVIIGGMGAFCVCALGCALAQSIEQLIIARLLLGTSAAAQAVMGYAILYDVFDKKERVRALAILGVALSVTPAVAPLLGGYIHVLFGWRVNFFVVFGIGSLATLFIVSWLPETNRNRSEALALVRVLHYYRELLGNREFMQYALITGLVLGAIFAFITAGPFIYIDRLGVATQHFGFYYGATVFGYIVGSMIARQMTSRLSVQTLLQGGLALSLIGCVLIVQQVYTGSLTSVSLSISVGVMFAGLGPVFAVAPVLALEATSSRAGAAAALLGSIELLTASLAALGVSIFHDGSARPFAVIVSSMMCLAWIVFRTARTA